MKLHHPPVFVDGMVNSTEVVVHSKTNFVKVVQNQLLFRKSLMLCAKQDRHVTYREIETTLGISETSIHSILHEHLTLFALDPTQFVNRSKKSRVDWSKEMLQKYDRGPSKHVYDRR